MADRPTILHLPDHEGRFYKVEFSRENALYHVRVIAETPGREPHSSDWRLDEQVLSQLDEAQMPPLESRWAWIYKGVMRMYLRRFPALLDNRHLDVSISSEQLQRFFFKRHGGDSLERIERDIEKIVIDLGMSISANTPTELDFSILDTWSIAQPTLARKQRRQEPHIKALYADLEQFFDKLTKKSRYWVGLEDTPDLGLIALGHPLLLDIIAAREEDTASSSASSNGHQPWPGDRAVHVHRIAVRDLRCFKEVELDLKAPERQQQGQWLVLLGNV